MSTFPFTAKKITVAEGSGFCFGVRRATSKLEERIRSKRQGERLLTLGSLIHNEVYNARLKAKGVETVDEERLYSLAEGASPDSPVTVFIRAHGITAECESRLGAIKAQNPSFDFVDCTCPYVKKIHGLAEKHSSEDNFFLLLGHPEHPETVGIMSRFDGEKFVFSSADELKRVVSGNTFVKMHNKTFKNIRLILLF